MTSKTFKSALDSPVTLEVERETHPAGVYLSIGQVTILLAASDAPALALAILEAAGYSEEYEGGNCWAGPLGQAMHMLRLETEAQERATAEAQERAELEAEALELHNAFWDGWDRNRIDSWDDQPGKATTSRAKQRTLGYPPPVVPVSSLRRPPSEPAPAKPGRAPCSMGLAEAVYLFDVPVRKCWLGD